MAQEFDPYIEYLRTDQRVFKGEIAGKYPITMSLRFFRYGHYNSDFYSVKGWYQYDKVGTKIPLVGINNLRNKLTLYVFDDPGMDSLVLHFGIDGLNHWEEEERYPNLKGYKERMWVSNDLESSTGLWTDGAKELGLVLRTESRDLLSERVILHLDSSTAVDLEEFELYGRSEILGVNEDRTRLLLMNTQPSATNAMAPCGAGSEVELVILEFDKSGLFQGIEKYPVESCHRGILSEKKSSPDAMMDTYLVEHQGKESVQVLKVNKKLASIEVE